MSEAAVVAREVRKRYGAVRALDGVSLEVERGEFFGLLGPNGAGKTTLISALGGLARADSGDLTVMGHDVVRGYREARRALGIVPQEVVFDPFLTVRETLQFQSGYFGLRKNDAWIDELLDRLGLAPKANANMRSLSGGMKRRVMVAQALVHRPPVIVLDEPTAGVDVGLRQGLWSFIRRLNRDGHTIVLTTHYLEEAEKLYDRITMLKTDKMIALDSTRNLLENFFGLVLKLRLDRNALSDGLQAEVMSSEDERFALRLRDYNALEQVLHHVRETDAAIKELELEPPDLEDVFLRVMEKH